MTARLTPAPIRSVSAQDLGYKHSAITFAAPSGGETKHNSPHHEMVPIERDNSVYLLTQDLLTDYGGVILVGPSGTGKSYHARRIALTLTDGDLGRCRFIQFHPSYQYEDFMEGFRPLPEGHGFKLREQHFVELSRQASADPNLTFVLVIDELSRGDPGRVFGEALTYLESSKRGIPFTLASGTELIVPRNLVILSTMNPLDHGASDVDAALDRRFAKIRMEPDTEQLRLFLVSAGMEDYLVARVTSFFQFVNSQAVRNPYMSIGHTYFIGIKDIDGLNRLWSCQLQFHFEKAFPFDSEALARIQAKWKKVVDSDG